MIEKVDNSVLENAKMIYSLFQASYAVEAEILGIDDFPPLKRKPKYFMESSTDFYGYRKEGRMAGLVEVLLENDIADIHSLVVHPNYFRQGIGRKLMTFVIENLNASRFLVETGLKNEPAINLYTKLGFVIIKEWTTDIGIEKVAFEK